MAHWKQKNLRLKDKHTWKSKPGYAICVLDRGAIRFDYPVGWKVDADEDSLKVRDKPEPDDNCVLAVSHMHLPADPADRVPLRHLVQVSVDNDQRGVLERKDIVELAREDGIEIAWGEVRFMDPKEKREALGRICIARGSGVYCLITFDFWKDDATKFEYVWKEVLRSLTLGVYIKDPTTGPVVQ